MNGHKRLLAAIALACLLGTIVFPAPAFAGAQGSNSRPGTEPAVSAQGQGQVRPASAVATLTGTSLTASWSASRVVCGRTVHVTARLTRAGGVLLPHRAIQLQSPMGKGYRVLATLTSNDGRYAITVNPVQKTYYRLYFSGDATYTACATAPWLISSTASLASPLCSTFVAQHRVFPVTAYIYPKHAAGSSGTCFQVIEKWGSQWHVVATFPAKVSDARTVSKLTAQVSLPHAGWAAVRVYHADAGHVASYSGAADIYAYTDPEPAIAWAMARLGSHAWDGWCLKFVCDAYAYTGTPVTRYDSAGTAARALNAAAHQGNPPRGAYVFYSSAQGHVGLSLGDGRMVHAFGSRGVVVTSQVIGMPRIGWAMPR